MLHKQTGFVHLIPRRLIDEGCWAGGRLEREGDKETSYCSCSSRKCLEKEVCFNSWQPGAPWLECGNSPGVSDEIPLVSSLVLSCGNVKATQGQSHLRPTSSGDNK